jgi:hypothetical protein
VSRVYEKDDVAFAMDKWQHSYSIAELHGISHIVISYYNRGIPMSWNGMIDKKEITPPQGKISIMRYQSFLTIFVFLCLLGMSPGKAQNTINRRDGNWWRTLGNDAKNSYVTGFFDGMNLGFQFSQWKYADDTTKRSCLENVNKSYNYYCEKFFSHITNLQVTDGLDNFYSEPGNRNILMFDAIWIVANEVAGIPDDAVQKIIENYRKKASR